MQKKITILGGGIMGLMNAYTLSQSHKITVHDPEGFPANNASFMAGGMLAPYSEIEHMDMNWVKAGLAGVGIWRNIDLDTGFNQNGSLLIAHPDDQYILERFKTHLPTEQKTSQNVQPLEAQLSEHHETGLFLEEEAHLDPAKTMTALYEYLNNHPNVTMQKDSPDEDSELIIDCRGMASNEPEIRGVKGETLTVHNPEFSLIRPVRLMHPRYPLYIIPRDNHHFMIGATVIESSENKAVSLRSSMELMSAAFALSPTFADAQIIDIKAGIRPSYPDNLPRITIKDNVISCNGLFRHGYLLAPIMAECVRDHLAGVEHTFMHLFIKDHINERAAA